jgi:phage-related protein
MSCSDERPLIWLGSSKKDLLALPTEVRKFFGHALDFAQRGEQHVAAKALKGFCGAGVLEITEDAMGDTYMEIIRQRLKIADVVARELRDEKANR